MNFENYGIYEWHARTLPLPDTSSDNMGGGDIHIIPDDTSKLSLSDRLQIGRAIIHNSEIPLNGLGLGGNDRLVLSFNNAIFDALPNAAEYYQARTDQLIPFDIPIVMEN